MSEALRDRFVCGLHNYKTQQHLLTIVDLTFQKAVQTAQGNEMAKKKASDMTQLEAWLLADLNKLSTSNTPACYRCSKIGHMPSKCRCKEWVCHNSGKKGHIAAACRGGTHNHHQRA